MAKVLDRNALSVELTKKGIEFNACSTDAELLALLENPPVTPVAVAFEGGVSEEVVRELIAEAIAELNAKIADLEGVEERISALLDAKIAEAVKKAA